MKHPLLAALVLPALALGALVTAAAPAGAHIGIDPAIVAPGSDATLTFSVPTESASASTTEVELYFPTDQPLAEAAVEPRPGWSYRISTRHLATPLDTPDGQVSEAVEKVTWTARTPADAIHPGEFATFVVAVGPMPAHGPLVFKTLQHYSDGSLVRWIDVPVAGQPEPEHPAAVLTIAAPNAAQPAQPVTPSHTPLVLATASLVISIAAFGVSVLRRGRAGGVR